MKSLVQTLILLMMMSIMKAELFKQFVLKIEDYVKTLEENINIMTEKEAIIENLKFKIELLNGTVTTQETRIEELNTTVTAHEATIAGQDATIQALQNNQNGKLNLAI